MVHSVDTGLHGLFLVVAYDAVTTTLQVIPQTMNPAAMDQDWPKDIALADVESLIAASGTGF